MEIEENSSFLIRRTNRPSIEFEEIELNHINVKDMLREIAWRLRYYSYDENRTKWRSDAIGGIRLRDTNQ